MNDMFLTTNSTIAYGGHQGTDELRIFALLFPYIGLQRKEGKYSVARKYTNYFKNANI